MNRIVEWVSYALPWWIWAIPIGALLVLAFVTAYRLFGWRNAFVALFVALLPAIAALSRQRGRQEGWKQRQDKDNRDAKNLVRKAEDARSKHRSTSPDKLFSDDGFRRD